MIKLHLTSTAIGRVSSWQRLVNQLTSLLEQITGLALVLTTHTYHFTANCNRRQDAALRIHLDSPFCRLKKSTAWSNLFYIYFSSSKVTRNATWIKQCVYLRCFCITVRLLQKRAEQTPPETVVKTDTTEMYSNWVCIVITTCTEKGEVSIYSKDREVWVLKTLPRSLQSVI